MSDQNLPVFEVKRLFLNWASADVRFRESSQERTSRSIVGDSDRGTFGILVKRVVCSEIYHHLCGSREMELMRGIGLGVGEHDSEGPGT